MEYFVKKKVDVFVLIINNNYQALPLVFHVKRNSPGHAVVVISPRVNLMKDQVESLQTLGIPAVSLSDIADREARASCNWLNNERWRKMLWSNIYTSKLCAIAVDEAHIIKQW